MPNRLLVLFLLVSFYTAMAAQNIMEIDEWLERYMESIENESDIDLSNLREKIEFRIENPLNLNNCSIEELEDLDVLNAQQLEAFDNYRNEFGDLYSIYELQAIPLFDIAMIRLLAPLVRVGKKGLDYHKSLLAMLKESKKKMHLKIKMQLENKNGYIGKDSLPPKYAGNKHTYYTKYRMKYGNKLDIGFIAEKDPGEAFFALNNKYGFDYYSGHIFLYRYKSWLKELNIGDYTISLGQGLILHNDFSRGKSALVNKIKKNTSRVIKPHSSVNENLYYRGVGATFSLNNHFDISLFGSMKKIDAGLQNVERDSIDSDFYASSLQLSGYHRTASEIKGKHSIGELVYGGRLNYNSKNLKIGLNFFNLKLSKPLIRQDKLHNIYRFSGNKLSNVSLDYSLLWNRILFFGELARSKNDTFAIIQGIQYVPSQYLDISVLYRKYPKDYESLNSNSFGETVGTNNEEGLYLGVNLNLGKGWSFAFYQDIWRFAWLRYSISAPSYGNEHLFLIKYKRRRKYSFYTQLKIENKAKDYYSDSSIKNVTNARIIRLRFHQNYKISKSWELRNRVEFSKFNHSEELFSGILIYQDIIFKTPNFPLSTTFRYAIFDIENYESAIYAYENDILGESLIPGYFRKGYSVYLNLRYRPIKNMIAEMRIARLYYPEEKSLGNNNEKINTNHKTDVKAQIIYKF